MAKHGKEQDGGYGGKGKSSSENEPSVTDSYAQAKREFRRVAGKSLGQLGGKRSEWERLARLHGADLLAKAVRIWAEEAGRQRVRDFNWPLAVFLKQAGEYIEAAQMEADEAQRKDREAEEAAWQEQARAQQAKRDSQTADAEYEEALARRRREEDAAEAAERLADEMAEKYPAE